MGEKNYKFDTIKVKGGYKPQEHNNYVQVPIYQTASYEPGGPEKLDNLRSRCLSRKLSHKYFLSLIYG
jgi:O-acetylhomoserine (thiol)-lyase